MLNSDEKKLVLAPETSKIISCRRNFLKWGVFGVLAAGPFGITAWRKSQRDKCKYRYVLETPIQRVEDDYFPYAAYGDASHWSGNTRGKMYTPQHVQLIPSGLFTEDPEVHVNVIFDVAEDAPKNLLALVKVSLWSDNTVFAVEEGEWRAPHKQPPRSRKYSEDSPTIWTVGIPEQYMLLAIPLADLGKIDKITVDIEELIRE
jgi:hypothetical protein